MLCILFKYFFYLTDFILPTISKIVWDTLIKVPQIKYVIMLISPNAYLLPLRREFFICRNWLQNLVCWKCVCGVQEHVILTEIWPKYEQFCNIQIKNISQSAVVLSWSQSGYDHMLKNLSLFSFLFFWLLLWI